MIREFRTDLLAARVVHLGRDAHVSLTPGHAPYLASKIRSSG